VEGVLDIFTQIAQQRVETAMKKKTTTTKRTREDVSREELYGGIVHYQPKRGAKVGTDTLLLVSFVKVEVGRPALELGAGTGLATLLLGKAGMYPAVGIELQPQLVEMARRSARESKIAEARFVHGDIRQHKTKPPFHRFAVIIANPPYYRLGEGLVSPLESRALSRHEIASSLEDYIVFGEKHLAPDGELDMILHAGRLGEAMALAQAAGLIPQRLAEVHPKPRAAAKHVLVSFCYSGKWQGEPIRRRVVLHMHDGSPSCALAALEKRLICPQLF
jgi:tRNA1Val (adenine37-N6)-methyltransferase